MVRDDVRLPAVQKIPVPQGSHPWNAAESQLVPIPLAAYHYREEEYFISGQARLFSLAGDHAECTAENIPYTDRILVRIPEDPSHFNGNIVIELLNSTNGFDVAPMWSLCWPAILRDGTVYIGLTIHPVCIAAMKRYDPSRYAPLTMAVPESRTVSDKVLMSHHCTPDTDFGLTWDILTQLGYMIHENRLPFLPENGEKKVYVMGCSQSSMFLSTYINVFHEYDRPSPLLPGFQGYLLFTGSVMVPLTQHQDPPAIGDPIQVTKNCPVPIIRIMSQWDFCGFAGDLAHRRPDSDEPGDRYRLYEIAGQAHNPFVGALYRPGRGDVKAIGRSVPYPAPSISELPTDAVVRQALRNLILWSQDRTIPPHAESGIELDVNGSVACDELGNPRGGLRLPQLDVPTSVYHSGTPSNPQDGWCEPLPPEVLHALYPSRDAYMDKWFACVDRFRMQGFISAEDADLLKRKAFTQKL